MTACFRTPALWHPLGLFPIGVSGWSLGIYGYASDGLPRLAVLPGNAALHLGPLPEGDPRDITDTEPQCQLTAQLGLCHGKDSPGRGSCCPRLVGPGCPDCHLSGPWVFGPLPSPFQSWPHSLQVLCCVDKQGILSWPNPSPETVLFFSGKVEPPHSSHEDLTDDLSNHSFCHPEVEEEVWPAPGGLACGHGSGGSAPLRAASEQ